MRIVKKNVVSSSRTKRYAARRVLEAFEDAYDYSVNGVVLMVKIDESLKLPEHC